MNSFVIERADRAGLTPGRPDFRSLFGFSSRPRYERLRARWRQEIQHLSWFDDIVNSPSAREITRGGLAMVRWLAEDLRDGEEGAHALMAILAHILGRGPDIPEEERGRRAAMRARWLSWLRSEGWL